MQNGHRGALPGHGLVGAIIGEDARQNKGKAIRPADVARSCAGTEGFEKSRRERKQIVQGVFKAAGRGKSASLG